MRRAPSFLRPAAILALTVCASATTAPPAILRDILSAASGTQVADAQPEALARIITTVSAAGRPKTFLRGLPDQFRVETRLLGASRLLARRG